jgi:transglutaminase-like putative cysteine protease
VRYRIEHTTTLTFPQPVREHQCELRLAPRDDVHQRRLRVTITVEPTAPLASYEDSFGNLVHHFSITAPHDALRTRLEAEVETLLENPFAYAALPTAREATWIADQMRTQPRLWDFVLHRSPFTPDVERLDHGLELPKHDRQTSVLESVQAAQRWVGEVLTYRSGVSTVDSPLETALRERAGVCQDFAHLLVAVVRSWGVPARYVMGYVDPGYQDEEEEPAAEATHAWAEVLIPGAGWRGFDAVHQLVVNDTYVAVAVGRDHRDAAPQRGAFRGDDPGKPPDVTLHVVGQQ